MEVQWYGNNCFFIKGSEATVLIDPDEQALKSLPKQVDILIRTTEVDKIKDPKGIEYGRRFDWPGEYESKGVAVTIIPMDPFKNTAQLAYLVIDGFHIANLGFISEEVHDDHAELLGNIDILMVPVGDNGVLKPKQATNVIEMIEPKLVIPTCVAHANLESEYGPVGDFIKEAGVTMPDPQAKLKLNNTSALPTDKTDFIQLVIS